MTDQVKEFMGRRGVAKGSITRLVLYADSITDRTPVSDIKTRLELLERSFSEFMECEMKLAAFDVASDMADYEIKYLNIKAKLSQALSVPTVKEEATQVEKMMSRMFKEQNEFLTSLSTTFTSSLNQTVSQSFDEQPHCSVRLPLLNIPTFSGDYKDFPCFKDLFSASVHSKLGLNEAEKFQYLKGYLRGEASDLIKHITVSEANYSQAWNKLCERYDKKRCVLNNFIRLFLEQPNSHHSSAKGLRRLYNVSDEVIRGLTALGSDANSKDAWLIYILLRKTDNETQEAWTHKTVSNEFPSFEEFLKFLSERADALEACEGNLKPSTAKAHQLNSREDISEDKKSIPVKCLICGESHRIYLCTEFKKLDATQRREKAAKLRMCFNCLSSNHRAMQCLSQANCMRCGRRHHTLLHENVNSSTLTNITTTSSTIPVNDSAATELPKGTITNLNLFSNGNTFLPTAEVKLKTRYGQLISVKLLMDSGSQSSFISEKCVRRLGISREKGRISVEGLATSHVSTTGRTSISIHSRFDHSKYLIVNVYILPNLTRLCANVVLKEEQERKIRSLRLADPNFSNKMEIEILLGADYFFDVLAATQIQLSPNIIAQETLFGYVIAGRREDAGQKEADWKSYKNFNIVISDDQSLEKLLRKFWEQETLLDEAPKTVEEEICENHFRSTTTKSNDGRFVVRLPFKSNQVRLGNSFKLALQRLISMERKMSKNPEFRKLYIEFMNEYITLGHMRLLQPHEIHVEGKEVYYLPHHGVVREHSSTTKLRVVFDGSAVSSNGESLNQNLLIGPTLQDTLWAILLRFRSFKVAICADIAKMYRQILIEPSQTSLQRILWRESPSKLIQHYELLTVTYGTSPAPFLAIRVLYQIANECEETHPEVARVIRKNFYVDDVLTGADDEADANDLKIKLIKVLDNSGFSLRKWLSNCSKLSEDNNSIQITGDCQGTYVLGLYWDPIKDMFSFKNTEILDKVTTKRGILSVASRIFDPLGWLSPFTVMVKVFLQGLWLKGLSWDEKLPIDIEGAWTSIQSQFKFLISVQIPRYVSNFKNSCQIHGFSDASEVAYSAAIYVRMELDKSIRTSLLTSKTKVAPIQQVSLPRLELCGAHLLAKLVKRVLTSLDVLDIEVYLWTDSMVVLSWLASHPRKWKTYVANRVASIHQLLPDSKWRYVSGRDNPADLATRGIMVNNLTKNDLWWKGPQWLSRSVSYWPTNPSGNVTLQERHEEKGSKICLMNTVCETTVIHPITRLLENVSSWTKVIRVMAYMLRVWHIAKKTIDFPSYITLSELEDAELRIIQFVQSHEFSEDIKNLNKYNRLQSNSKLTSLAPFIDSKGTLRVGGRLQNLKCAYNIKHPIILPRRHIIVTLILEYLHKRYLHPGPSLLTALSRQKFWILGVREASCTISHKCLICVRHSNIRSTQQMGSLPESRVTPNRPFSITGIDYAGPISLLSRKGRGGTLIKGFIVIFVCLVTKALHIDVASDLTTDAFLAALDRFIARRGAPAEIYSDNGSNFLGAKRRLYEYYNLVTSVEFKTKINNYAPAHNIKWHFIPPISPHFGGLWERAVRSVKTHLIKVTGNSHLTFEEMITVLTRIEGILNSRPLCAIRNEDTSNIDALTPAHFLTLGPITALPCPNYEEVKLSSINRWERLQKLVQHFWRHYSISYLNTLHQRTKWQRAAPNLEINDIVLLHDAKSSPCNWPLGRVIELHKGSDGTVRVVTIQTKSSSFKRPITRLYRLPIDD